jgi:WhiB family redox-sensing transcriptional regulator
MSGVGDDPLVDWRRLAACRSADPDLFFPISVGDGAGQVEKAKALCGACAVRRQCLQYAISGDEADGVWGGLTGDERSRVSSLARARGRAPGTGGVRARPLTKGNFSPHS